MNYIIKKINKDEYLEATKELFYKVFSKEPWNDKWDLSQLDLYIKDLFFQNNSLCFGLFLNDKLIGLSLGRLMHFYRGNEYRIDEFCIDNNIQNNGLGSKFMNLLLEKIKEDNIKYLLLSTNKSFKAYKFYLKNGFKEVYDNINLVKEI